MGEKITQDLKRQDRKPGHPSQLRYCTHREATHTFQSKRTWPRKAGAWLPDSMRGDTREGRHTKSTHMTNYCTYSDTSGICRSVRPPSWVERLVRRLLSVKAGSRQCCTARPYRAMLFNNQEGRKTITGVIYPRGEQTRDWARLSINNQPDTRRSGVPKRT